MPALQREVQQHSAAQPTLDESMELVQARRPLECLDHLHSAANARSCRTALYPYPTGSGTRKMELIMVHTPRAARCCL